MIIPIKKIILGNSKLNNNLPKRLQNLNQYVTNDGGNLIKNPDGSYRINVNDEEIYNISKNGQIQHQFSNNDQIKYLNIKERGIPQSQEFKNKNRVNINNFAEWHRNSL